MMSSEHIIDVDETSFPNEVIAFSNSVPVVVYLWAEWCQPCHLLTPTLEKLAHEMNGAFRLARVNADENPNLNLQLGVYTLPTVKAYHRGRHVNEFTSVQTESFIREFLRNLVPSAGNLTMERAQGLLGMKKYPEAIEAYRSALKADPDNSAAMLGLARSLISRGEPADALSVLMDFPAGKHYGDAEKLAHLAGSISRLKTDPEHFGESDLSMSFRRSLILISRDNQAAAADGFLAVLRQDKTYLDGEVHRAMVGLLILMDDNHPETRQYRNELASVLF